MGVGYAQSNIGRVFGMKLVRKGLRQKDREFMELKSQIDEVLHAFIKKAKDEYSQI